MRGGTWVVEIRIDDNGPQVCGPYTETQANSVVTKLEEEVDLATDRYGIVHHPFSVLGATAYPLGRYDSFLTAEQRRDARSEARQAALSEEGQ